jgi:hypothetical protein
MDPMYAPPPPYPPASPTGIDAPGAKPPTYLVWAILTTLFCCLPVGLVSVVFAVLVHTSWSAGRWDAARDHSRKAKMFAIGAAAAGLAIIGTGFAIGLAGVA